MYQAELKGKISSKLEEAEDLITSNVFSFFKYADRSAYLRAYLSEAFDICVSQQEALAAQFFFWPTYEDGTEPDLVLLVGDHYLLFEAKYHSGFGEKTDSIAAQLDREIDGGLKEADLLNKKFRLIAITNDAVEPEDVGVARRNSKNQFSVHWTNWQFVATFLYKATVANSLNLPQNDLVNDLYDLLDKKKLRSFLGIEGLQFVKQQKTYDYLFIESHDMKFRGEFIGFNESLKQDYKIGRFSSKIFYEGSRTFFEIKTRQIHKQSLVEHIFYTKL